MGVEERPARLVFGPGSGGKISTSSLRDSTIFGDVGIFLCRCARRARKIINQGHFMHFSGGFLLRDRPAQHHKCRLSQWYYAIATKATQHMAQPCAQTTQQMCHHSLKLCTAVSCSKQPGQHTERQQQHAGTHSSEKNVRQSRKAHTQAQHRAPVACALPLSPALPQPQPLASTGQPHSRSHHRSRRCCRRGRATGLARLHTTPRSGTVEARDMLDARSWQRPRQQQTRSQRRSSSDFHLAAQRTRRRSALVGHPVRVPCVQRVGRRAASAPGRRSRL